MSQMHYGQRTAEILELSESKNVSLTIHTRSQRFTLSVTAKSAYCFVLFDLISEGCYQLLARSFELNAGKCALFG